MDLVDEGPYETACDAKIHSRPEVVRHVFAVRTRRNREFALSSVVKSDIIKVHAENSPSRTHYRTLEERST